MLFGNKKAIINLSAMKRNLESHAYLLVICYFERSQCLFCSFGHNKRFAQTNDQKIGQKENEKCVAYFPLFSFWHAIRGFIFLALTFGRVWF